VLKFEGESTFCGIAGYVGPGDKSLLKGMIDVLEHRGPDDTGFFVDENVGVGNARLSIIDIEGGHQPIQNETGTIHATYNGEIYNFVQLRQELEKQGHKFRTRSDSEVIVHSYEQYGTGFVEKLNGMFAIALWDSTKKTLLLTRDRMGIKPLYYSVNGDTLLFASEIKAILQAPLRRVIDETSLYAILSLGYIPSSKTMLQGVYKIPPSSMLVYKDNSAEFRAYWDAPPLNAEANQTQLVQQLHSVLRDVVGDQLVADVPVGCLLSGGLDTSTIVAYASKVVNKPLKTFCMGFGQETDELRDARIVADLFGTDHQELIVGSSEAMKLYPRMIWHMETPMYDLFPWFVFKLARRDVKVCLTGTGGDELFGGYTNRYRAALRIQALSSSSASGLLRRSGNIFRRVPSHIEVQNRLRVLSSLGDEVECYLALTGSLPDTLAKKLFKNPSNTLQSLRGYFAPCFEEEDFLQGVINADLRTRLVNQFLAVDDSMSMSNSLELRVPLLDNRIVDLMCPIPWRMKYAPGGVGKLPLRDVAHEILPKEILEKQKRGFFSFNVSEWFKGELGELARQLLPESDAIQKYFSSDFIQKIVARRRFTWDRRYHLLAWQLVGFHFWHRMFLDSKQTHSLSFKLNELS
jgi:asparagine synthase (glutamine-hydrolysing)